jgi:hypothetical protein
MEEKLISLIIIDRETEMQGNQNTSSRSQRHARQSQDRNPSAVSGSYTRHLPWKGKDPKVKSWP